MGSDPSTVWDFLMFTAFMAGTVIILFILAREDR